MKNVKNTVCFLILTLVFALAVSCSSAGEDGDVNNSGNNSSNGVSVYVAGGWADDETMAYCYWKNGVRYDLPLPAGYEIDDEAIGIAVYEGSVYVSGIVFSGDDVIPCYWKDGTRFDLLIPADAYADRESSSITVYEGSVYVLGTYYTGSYETYNSTACYWKDVVRFDLPVLAGDAAGAYGIAVSGGSVYVSGVYWSADGLIPCYWKDSVRFDLPVPAGNDGVASEIAVSGGSVYVSGIYYSGSWSDGTFQSTACYWKDGIRIDLPVPAEAKGEASGITVSGGSVYVSGAYYTGNWEIPCYWKDGVRFDLPVPAGNIAGAYGIAVSGGSVYVVGGGINIDLNQQPSTGYYWKDGVRIDLPVPVGAQVYAGGITVVEN